MEESTKYMFKKREGSKLYKKFILEEYILIIKEPNSKFLGYHVTLKYNTEKGIADSILEFLENTAKNFKLYCY